MRGWRRWWAYEVRRPSVFYLLLNGKPVGIGGDYWLIVYIIRCHGWWRLIRCCIGTIRNSERESRCRFFRGNGGLLIIGATVMVNWWCHVKGWMYDWLLKTMNGAIVTW